MTSSASASSRRMARATRYRRWLWRRMRISKRAASPARMRATTSSSVQPSSLAASKMEMLPMAAPSLLRGPTPLPGYEESRWAGGALLLHLVPDLPGQLLDLLRLLDHVQGKHVFVGVVHVLLEFGGQFEQLVGVALQRLEAGLVAALGLLPFHADH